MCQRFAIKKNKRWRLEISVLFRRLIKWYIKINSMDEKRMYYAPYRKISEMIYNLT